MSVRTLTVEGELPESRSAKRKNANAIPGTEQQAIKSMEHA